MVRTSENSKRFCVGILDVEGSAAMKTDKNLHTIFAACPQWIFELTGLDSPGECEWKAVVLKALEQKPDGVIFPADPARPLTVVEFQFQDDPAIYARTVIEMALLQQEHGMRAVQGLIFFRFPSLDPQTEPWRQVIGAYSLREVLKSLAQRAPGHPLVALFQPVLLSNEETLEKHAAAYYNQIKISGLAEPVKTVLLDVFVNWLEKRLKHMGKKEIENMLLGELADLRDTQSGKDLIQIGKEEGITEGKIMGKIEGKQEYLILALEARFGTVGTEVRQRIEQVQNVEKLRDLLLQVFKVNSVDELKW
jgi:predicted transposase YdaD